MRSTRMPLDGHEWLAPTTRTGGSAVDVRVNVPGGTKIYVVVDYENSRSSPALYEFRRSTFLSRQRANRHLSHSIANGTRARR